MEVVARPVEDGLGKLGAVAEAEPAPAAPTSRSDLSAESPARTPRAPSPAVYAAELSPMPKPKTINGLTGEPT
jgi:hypothetical protein